MSRNSHLQKHLCLAVTMVTILFGIVTDAAGQTATRPKSKKQRVMTGVRFEGKTSTVSMVIKGGPAAKAGVKVGDEILSVGEKYIIQPDDLRDAIVNKRIGDVVKLEVKRKNQFMFFNLKLIEAIKGNVEINADGSVTYTFTHPANNYSDGDDIYVRFYSFTPQIGQVFSPGPGDNVWSDAFGY